MYDVERIDRASFYLKFLEKIDLKNINDAIQGDIINTIVIGLNPILNGIYERIGDEIKDHLIDIIEDKLESR